ncbi:hypothetical protein L596_012599 [Steinernema carpocapsae]|uniref:G-protein coupled receptors family 1 profile domain-containing protein n=1 Tax=Steinernema carpocapsae TaxID=34508 RepID=A0A4U5NYF6_STECR|nr:hypothetical protein L596_012599 [Steinernema carpocapsae]
MAICMNVSQLSHLYLALNRAVVIFSPTRYKSIFSERVVYASTVFAWVLAIIICLPYFLPAYQIVFSVKDTVILQPSNQSVWVDIATYCSLSNLAILVVVDLIVFIRIKTVSILQNAAGTPGSARSKQKTLMERRFFFQVQISIFSRSNCINFSRFAKFFYSH